MTHVKLFSAAVVFFIALLSGVKNAPAAFPIDTWNLTISGRVTGVGYVTFLDDLEWGKIVRGWIIIEPTPNLKPANTPAAFHVGSFSIDGVWSFDANGGITGFFSGGSEEVALDASFTATGTATKLSMKANTTNGVMNVKGIPSSSLKVPTTDLSGDWVAQVEKNGVRVTELFTLEPFGDLCVWREIPDPADADPITPPNPTIIECVLTVPAPNTYNLFGIHPFSGGPGYDILGTVILSAGNKLGLVLEEFKVNKDTGDVAETGTVRSLVGSFKATVPSARLKGTDDDATNAVVPSVFMIMTGSP